MTDSNRHNGSNGHSNNGHSNNGSNRRHLSEISHLFLSEIRTNGQAAPRPRRTPPGHVPVEEQSKESVKEQAAPNASAFVGRATTPVTAVVGARLDRSFVRRTLSHAGAIAADGAGPVGVAVVEATRLEIYTVHEGDVPAEGDEPLHTINPLEIGDAVGELACDVARWLVVLPDPRLPQARRLLGRCGGWTLLATADHEGVVNGYRMLKSLCDLDLPAGLSDSNASDGDLPRVSLVMLDAESPEAADKAARKLAGVCGQFLDLPVDPAADHGAEATGDWTSRPVLTGEWPGAADAAPAWAELERQLLGDAADVAVEIPLKPDSSELSNDSQEVEPMPATPAIFDEAIPDLARPMPRKQPAPAAPVAPAAPAPVMPAPVAAPQPAPVQPTMTYTGAAESTAVYDEVIDLPADGDLVSAALAANLSQFQGLVMTPVVPPMWPGAKLAVRRDGGLSLIAAPSMNDLTGVAKAMDWAKENASLLAMALNQFRLDPAQPLQVELIADRADTNAAALAPLLARGEVRVTCFRRIRWSGREGLLLEAA